MLKNILIVDDDPGMIQLVSDYLKLYGVTGSQIFTSEDPLEALEIFNKNKHSISLLICDYYMPKANGVELCELLKTAQPNLSIILQTGDPSIKVAMLKNIDTVLHKPFDFKGFEAAMDSQSFNLPKFTHPRVEERVPLGKEQSSVIITKGTEVALNGLVYNLSMGGCGVILSSASGLNIGDQVKVAKSDLNSSSGKQQSHEEYDAIVAWMEFVDIETFKIGLKYI
jgi:CheY-like chemotaxis protein